jgi:hypothetical protein
MNPQRYLDPFNQVFLEAIGGEFSKRLSIDIRVHAEYPAPASRTTENEYCGEVEKARLTDDGKPRLAAAAD